MRRRTAALALAGAVGLGGLVAVPALAAAPGERGVPEQVERLTQALQGLVDDETLTPEQRDAVASRLAEHLPPHGRGLGPGPGHGHGHGRGLGHGPAEGHERGKALGPGAGRGHGKALGHLGGGRVALDVAAETLGVDESELRARLRGGDSLADVAQERGVDLGVLTEALTRAANEQLDEAVADGRLKPEQADERRARVAERVGEAVQRSSD